MTLDELLEEARRLARPCVHLRAAEPGQSGAIAIWRGQGVHPVPEPTASHWVSFEASAVPSKRPVPGWISVWYTQDCKVIALSGPIKVDPMQTMGQPLVGARGLSLPPVDAIFARGSEVVGRWLESLGWGRESEYQSNFDRLSPVAADYEQVWQAQCPIFTRNGIVATLGGWNMSWPEGDFPALLDLDLLIWTFEDSEPWIEVWADGSALRAIGRIT